MLKSDCSGEARFALHVHIRQYECCHYLCMVMALISIDSVPSVGNTPCRVMMQALRAGSSQRKEGYAVRQFAVLHAKPHYLVNSVIDTFCCTKTD